MRVFVTSTKLRSGDSRYDWVDTTFGVMEGVLDTESLVARGALHACHATVG